MDSTTTDKIRSRLEHDRRELLDLTARNRLLNTRLRNAKARQVEIVGETAEDIFRLLVLDEKALGFLPRPEDIVEASPAPPSDGADQPQTTPPADAEDTVAPNTADATSADDAPIPEVAQANSEVESAAGGDTADDDAHWLPQPNDEVERRGDADLQTRLKSEALQKRLLSMYYDARTFEEEQGVNVLYLALGFLKWFDAAAPDRERFAPLVLVPVELLRASAKARFRLRFRDGELATNLSLEAKLKADFGLALPELPDIDDLKCEVYFDSVRRAVASQRNWEVLGDELLLGFFSFSKFLMFRDLDPERWPAENSLVEHGSVSALLGGGFESQPPLCGDDAEIDSLIDPRQCLHVVDADGSQAVAIEEVRRGRNLVIQGPPGTGKSQTITNLIAAAVHAGKRVLFVAEKMAALEVVKRRLDNIGLGAMCLELHSNKANKRGVLDELRKTLELGRPVVEGVEEQAKALCAARDQLNAHVRAMHTPLSPSGLTPYTILGELVRLKQANVPNADYALASAVDWTADDVARRRNLLADLAEHVAALGTPAAHPWRGSKLDAVLPMDIDRLRDRIPGALEKLSRAAERGGELAELVDVSDGNSLDALVELARVARLVADAPEFDATSATDTVWNSRQGEIAELVESAAALAASEKKLGDQVVESAWTTDFSKTRQDLAAWGRSPFRWLNRPYREARRRFLGILKGPDPWSLAGRLELLDTLSAYQKALWEVEVRDTTRELGRRAFGDAWRGAKSDTAALERVVAWERRAKELGVSLAARRALVGGGDRTRFARMADELDRHTETARADLAGVLESVKLDVSAAFGVAGLGEVDIANLRERLEAWRAAPERLSQWIAYWLRASKLPGEGLAELAARIEDGRCAPANIADWFSAAYHEALIRAAFAARTELARFSAASHEKIIDEFRRRDVERIELARREAALAHHDRIPREQLGSGGMSLIRREIGKKRRHLPLRQLFAQAGRAVQTIKPVFMMSPISVAQYIEPGAVDFDLLLIDEASQIRPVDALGAVARAKQLVVVGDNKQLPPTQFFNKLMGADDEPEEEDDFSAADLDSILDLCSAQNMSQRMLRWHYRSRHHSLIACSNHEFYDGRLFVIPSPTTKAAGGGLVFHHLPHTHFDRGKTATNRGEARAVAEAVIDHARRFPAKSLGVGTFSVGQRDAILDELETLRRADGVAEEFFATAAAEPFFVKNLENIQGDERDVIFISVGYGRDANGKLHMNFGPLSNDGGQRRLNVLITRAKERCEVFSSITAQDIDINRAKSRGVAALKTFLAYAAGGDLHAEADPMPAAGGEVFEQDVAGAIARLGPRVESRVGVAGCFVDLAVVDGDDASRYVLGIECDGPGYAAARWARDRDRLRRQVLEDRGWVLHRAWSADWFQRPEEQLRASAAAIEQAKITWATRAAQAEPDAGIAPLAEVATAPAQSPAAVDDIERDEDAGGSFNGISEPYKEETKKVTSRVALADAKLTEVVKHAVRVATTEGPIHRDELTRRLASLWNSARVGSRISETVKKAIDSAIETRQLSADGEFVDIPNRVPPRVRDREGVASATLRKSEFLPPAEVRLAIARVVAAQVGATADELAGETARALGIRAAASIRELIDGQIKSMVDSRELERRGDRFHAVGD